MINPGMTKEELKSKRGEYVTMEWLISASWTPGVEAIIRDEFNPEIVTIHFDGTGRVTVFNTDGMPKQEAPILAKQEAPIAPKSKPKQKAPKNVAVDPETVPIEVKRYAPKKYWGIIEEIYHDIDGWWAHLAEGHTSTVTETGTLHEDTIRELKATFKSILTEEEFRNS